MKLYTLATAGKRMQELLNEIARLRARNAELVVALEKVTNRLLEADFDYNYERGTQENSEAVITLASEARAAIAAAEKE